MSLGGPLSPPCHTTSTAAAIWSTPPPASHRRSNHNGGVCAPEGGGEAAVGGTAAAVPRPDVVGKRPTIAPWRLLCRREAGGVRGRVEQSGAPVGRPRAAPARILEWTALEPPPAAPAESLSPVPRPARGRPPPAGLVRSRTSRPPTVFSEPVAARRGALAPKNRQADPRAGAPSAE